MGRFLAWLAIMVVAAAFSPARSQQRVWPFYERVQKTANNPKLIDTLAFNTRGRDKYCYDYSYISLNGTNYFTLKYDGVVIWVDTFSTAGQSFDSEERGPIIDTLIVQRAASANKVFAIGGHE